jgi:hypothetical protein
VPRVSGDAPYILGARSGAASNAPRRFASVDWATAQPHVVVKRRVRHHRHARNDLCEFKIFGPRASVVSPALV